MVLPSAEVVSTGTGVKVGVVVGVSEVEDAIVNDDVTEDSVKIGLVAVNDAGLKEITFAVELAELVLESYISGLDG